MTIRKDVSTVQPIWNDGQRVDEDDFESEQLHNNQLAAAMINNHFGSGVLPSSATQNIIFDSDNLDADQASLLGAQDFDGTGLSVHAQPSDVNLGNQLEVELTGSAAVGRLSVKVAIIGLSFDDTLQVDRFYFYRNEKQVTSKHYKKVLSVIFNDFKGNNNCSRSLGGRVVIRETASFQISRDPLMTAQDVEPDLFWRDFKRADLSISLQQMLQNAIGAEYSVDALGINTTGRPSRHLDASDVTSQIGQKFKAKTNNIQKVTLLLGVEKNSLAPVEDYYDWTGDLVVSIYALQSTIRSASDIVPELAIDFEPKNEPIVQLSYNQESLKDYGVVLTDVLQPVDFVFNATAVGSSSKPVIEVGKFYAITVKRSGAATGGKILVGVGNDKVEDSRVTLFSSVWVDVPEEDLWFQVWTDAAKIADGQGYDAGVGIQISKTTTDSLTGAQIDNESRYYSLVDSGENILNTAVLQATTEQSVVVQDERTGNNIFSRQKPAPTLSFVTDAELESLKSVGEPLVVGSFQDTNPKLNPILEKLQKYPGLAKGNKFCVVNPDADLLSLNLLGSKLVPNSDNAETNYKIVKITQCTDGYGDVNADGVIDSVDVVRVSQLVGESLFYTSTQQKIYDGEIDTLELLRADVDGDGYVTSDDLDLITDYVNRDISAFPVGTSFTHICFELQPTVGRLDGYYDCDGYIRLDGYDGLNIVDPNSLSKDEQVYNGWNFVPMLELDPAFTTAPFSEVEYKVEPLPYWQPWLLAVSSKARQVSASFSSSTQVTSNSSEESTTFKCLDKNEVVPSHDPGRNDFYVPDHLIIGKGEIIRPDGSFYKHDLEIGTIVLNLPEVVLEETAINVFDLFIADRGDGFTIGHYPAMRYADYSTVQPEDLTLNRVRFGVSIQSISKNMDGYSESDGYVAILDENVGIHIDDATGILKLNIKNLATDPVYSTLISKIQIQAFLKKGGWNNKVLNIPVDIMKNILT